MSKQNSWPALIQLAGDTTDKAAQQLQILLSERRQAGEQMDALQSYRDDYENRLQTAATQGISTANYHNFRQFIGTLDEAISQQNKVIIQLDARVERGFAQWREEKRRLRSYEALRDRMLQERKLQANRNEQRASDELSANLHRRVRSSY